MRILNENSGKKIINYCVIITLCCMVTLLCHIPVCAAESDYEYSVDENNEVTITGYVGTETDVVIPDALGGGKVAWIGPDAFSGCSSLNSVVIPESVTGIGPGAFSGCSSLSSIVIPESVTILGNSAFLDCSSLKTAGPIGSGSDIEFGWKTAIPSYAFYNFSSLSSIIIPEGVTVIGPGTFSGCSSLSSIVIPESVTSISASAFPDCSSLKTAGPIGSGADIEFGWKTTIPSYAFYNLSGLSSIVIPEGVTSIGPGTFSGCSSLSNIVIPDSVTGIDTSAFPDCGSLKTAGPIGSGADIEFGWKEAIPSFCLTNFSNLSSIVIPEGVKSIGYCAFYGCRKLSDVVIPESVTSIGYRAFKDCSSLSNIEIPKNVTSIESEAFSDCTGLIKIRNNSEMVIDLISINPGVQWYNMKTGAIIKSLGTGAAVTRKEMAGDEEQVRAFVKRLYTLVLEREAEEAGFDSWTELLLEKTSSGVDTGYGFVFSPECNERNLSNDDFVEMLYNTFMNRPSDEGGKSAWVSQLESGVEREKIFEGFVYSDEFLGICKSCGIEVGNTESVEAFADALSHYCNQNADVTAFVARCYTKALGREYDPVGLEDWCRVIITQDDTPTNVAKCFIFSEEFTGKKLSDEEYVKVLYRTFMGREADDKGLLDWIGVLQSGEEDREKVLDGFADSLEFAEILEGFGLN